MLFVNSVQLIGGLYHNDCWNLKSTTFSFSCLAKLIVGQSNTPAGNYWLPLVESRNCLIKNFHFLFLDHIKYYFPSVFVDFQESIEKE